MAGYGRSAPAGRDQDISVAAQAGYLLAWLDRLEVGRVVLVGHDLGGGVVQIVATRRPDRCAGMVLTNSIAYDSWPIPSVRFMQASSALVERLPQEVFRPLLRSFIRRGHDDSARASESMTIHWRAYAEGGGAAAFARQLRSLRTRDTLTVAPALPSLRVPTRVIWGAADQFQKVAYGERLARDLGVELLRIEGGKHFTPEDHPDPLASAINEVVAEVGARAAPRLAASQPERERGRAAG
jgi:pimeloyl-ACP methyl ester carboxylesterase